MSSVIKVALAKDQRLDDRGNSLPPGTPIAEIKFNPEIPGSFQTLAYLGSALSSCRVVDEKALPKQFTLEEVRKPVAPMMPDLVSE